MTRQQSARTVRFLLLLSLFIVVSVNCSFAQSVRSRGMGGAFIGLSDDESAIFYNPAGLSQIQGREASLQVKVNERDIYDWASLAFTGHIYEEGEENKFSITDYLEHNILEEPIPRRPKYSYGVSYSSDNRDFGFGDLVGGEYRGEKREVQDLQLAFGTRFPIARRMLAREQLFGGIKFRMLNVERTKSGGFGSSKRDSISMGAGLMYHYNDTITCGLTVDNIFEDSDGSEKAEPSINFGTAFEITKGTIVSADIVNITNNSNINERQYRVGVEKKFIENDLTMRMGSLNGTLTLGFGMQMLPQVRLDYSYYDGEVVAEHHVGAHVTFD